MTKTQLSILTLAATHDAVACAVGGAERLANGETRKIALLQTPRAGAVCNTLVNAGLLRELPTGDVRVARADGGEWSAASYVITDAGRDAATEQKKAG